MRSGRAIRAGLGTLAVALVLGGCGTATVIKQPAGRTAAGSGSSSAPVPKRSVPRPGASVRVQRGDTLYSIARRYQINPNDLAAWNNLSSPDTIYPGQSLRLYPVARAPATTVRPSSSTTTTVGKGSAPATAASAAPASSGFAWRWPADGSVISTYLAGETTRQGIDIAGRAGQPVRAAADGVVVYSGNGLVGYGELIIVKHNEQWLSAYGHNRKRLVAEGTRVKAGQQIAEMGRTGTSRDMLHFEIRYNGKAVDPQRYLPPR